jgi:hypothetical protein
VFGEGFHYPEVIGVSLHGTRSPVAGGTIVEDALDNPFINCNAVEGCDVADGVDLEYLCGLPKDNIVPSGQI